jgi:hypothetical protein
MKAIDIISRKVSAEMALEQIAYGHVRVFEYGPVVFTVNIYDGANTVHLYSDGAGHSILRAGRLFMQEVWQDLPQCTKLMAPIMSDKVKSFALKLGWKSSNLCYVTGHELFIIERP